LEQSHLFFLGGFGVAIASVGGEQFSFLEFLIFDLLFFQVFQMLTKLNRLAIPVLKRLRSWLRVTNSLLLCS
jgi:hypothetical protein